MAAIVCASSTCLAVKAQNQLPVVKSNTSVVSIRDGKNLSKNSWNLAPDAKPDIYSVGLLNGEPHRVTFITDVDSISFTVEENKKYDFIIQHNKDACYTQIIGKRKFIWDENKFWETPAINTAYQANISENEKIAGLSKFWSEVKYNFINFPLVPDLDWDAAYVEYLPRVRQTTSTLDYYRVLQEMCAKLKDAHTNVYTPNELAPAVYAKPLINTQLIEDKVLITAVLNESLRQQGVAVGQEVVEVDGLPVKEYAAKFVAPFQSASTPQDLDTRLYNYSLLRGAAEKPIVVTLRSAKGKMLRQTLPRISPAARRELKLPEKPVFELAMLPNNIAYVTLNSFDSNEAADKFKAAFAKISAADALIIDVRNNDGGNSGVGYAVLGCLTDKPFKASKWYTRDYRPAYRAWGRPQETFGAEANDWQPNGEKRYPKPVVVLTSPRTFSAAEDFAVAFATMRRGQIIGEPTGGSTGQPLFLRLPGHGSARICTKHDSFADGQEFVGVGVRPDQLVHPTVRDFRAGRDTVLDAALATLKKAAGKK